jgi:autotransporter-associated beta strand protein
LQIGNGGTSGSIAGNVTNDAALVFNRSDAVTFGGDIGGSGTVAKLGAGVLSLTGANTYTGVTVIDAGTLSVNGSIASSSRRDFGRGVRPDIFHCRSSWLTRGRIFKVDRLSAFAISSAVAPLGMIGELCQHRDLHCWRRGAHCLI